MADSVRWMVRASTRKASRTKLGASGTGSGPAEIAVATAVRIESDGTIRLPAVMIRQLSGVTELAVWASADTIILKRSKPVLPSGIAERAPGKEMPLREIVAEVHRSRREKRRERA